MTWLRYTDEVETIAPGEAGLFARIIDVMRRGADKVAAREGRQLRAGHSKALGIAAGTLTVTPGLPPELAQGLFAAPARYDALVRLAHLPAELLDDRGVSAARGFALKLFGVPGPKLPGHDAETQDWLFDTGSFFNAPDATTFLAEISGVLATTVLPDALKSTVSTAVRAAAHVLHVAGLESAHLDVLGHQRLHPLSETFYTQTPLRFGDHVAKLRLRPLGREVDQRMAIDCADGMVDTVTAEIATRGMAWQLEAQLRTDTAAMPLEDASARWPETDSPYREVARLTCRPQGCSDARRAFVEGLSFAPGHSLAAHRPLGQINRARLVCYAALARHRREGSSQPTAEPAAMAAIPA